MKSESDRLTVTQLLLLRRDDVTKKQTTLHIVKITYDKYIQIIHMIVSSLCYLPGDNDNLVLNCFARSYRKQFDLDRCLVTTQG